MDNSIVDRACREIAFNHHKIIDDWCKAYMAQIYQETGSIKPGDFILNEQNLNWKEGKLGKRYWFEPKNGCPACQSRLDQIPKEE